LRAWAEVEGLMLEDGDFERRWMDGGQREGTEHQVYFDPPTQRWFKRNNLCNHGHWLEYFQRLQLHHVLFPEAPLRLEGFVAHDGEFQPIVSQPDVQADPGAAWDEPTARTATRAFLRAAGFEPVDNPTRKDDYYSPSLGVEINDMHNENVIQTKAGVAAFDPVPRLDWAHKFHRIKARLGL